MRMVWGFGWFMAGVMFVYFGANLLISVPPVVHWIKEWATGELRFSQPFMGVVFLGVRFAITWGFYQLAAMCWRRSRKTKVQA